MARTTRIDVIVVVVTTARASIIFLVRNEIRRLLEIMRLNVADMQKSVVTDPKVDKNRLKTLFDIDDDSLVDIAYIVVVRRAFHIKLFERVVFNDGNAEFFLKPRVD